MARKASRGRRPSYAQEKRAAAKTQSNPGFTRSEGSLIDPRTVRRFALGTITLSVLGSPIAFALLSVEVPPKVEAAELAPEPRVEAAPPTDARPGVVRRAGDGLFYVQLRANGAPLRCLVDTGASDLVLSAEEAAQVGLASEDVDYDHEIATAGGMRTAARTWARSVEVAGHRFERVPLVLVKGARTPCLMGQRLLARLDAVEIRADELRLR